jgi:hypothetical protein
LPLSIEKRIARFKGNPSFISSHMVAFIKIGDPGFLFEKSGLFSEDQTGRRKKRRDEKRVRTKIMCLRPINLFNLVAIFFIRVSFL